MTARLQQILDELVGLPCLDPKGLNGLVSDLREELDKPAVLWPEGVMDAVAKHVSPSVHNPESRTFKSLDRRIAWAVGTWMERYGPMTDAQRSYMATILIWAVRNTAREAGGDKRRMYSHLLTEISSLVNHDTVAAGFKSRAARTVDVSRQLVRLGDGKGY